MEMPIRKDSFNRQSIFVGAAVLDFAGKALTKRLLYCSFLAATAFILSSSRAVSQSDPETRVVNYIRDHLRPGQPLMVTDLYNKVFTEPEERKALDKLYNAFFRVPLFIAQYQEKFKKPPALKAIADQFDLHAPGAADVLLRVMQSDPRVPHFLQRDPKTGEIKSIDVGAIRSDPRFGEQLDRQLTGWEGRRAPPFSLNRLDDGDLDSGSLRDKVVLLYVWFTGCPPCMQETPILVALERELGGRGLAIVGANADRLLGLEYDDGVRRRYAEEKKINFPLVHWTKEGDAAYGKISIFPTLFLINRKGIIAQHWVGFVSAQDLRKAITANL